MVETLQAAGESTLVDALLPSQHRLLAGRLFLDLWDADGKTVTEQKLAEQLGLPADLHVIRHCLQHFELATTTWPWSARVVAVSGGGWRIQNHPVLTHEFLTDEFVFRRAGLQE